MSIQSYVPKERKAPKSGVIDNYLVNGKRCFYKSEERKRQLHQIIAVQQKRSDILRNDTHLNPVVYAHAINFLEKL